mgnify:FL=1
MIRRDGTLQRGRPLNIPGEHTVNFDENSIAIAFVGGYNCPTGTKNYELYQSAESLTRSQFNTFDVIVEVLFGYYPGIRVVGHNHLNGNEFDPGFDVVNYTVNRFSKTENV